MKKLTTAFACILVCYIMTTNTQAEVAFNDSRVMLVIPASEPVLQLIIDYHSGDLSGLDQIHKLGTFNAVQARQYFNQETTDRQRAELVAEKIKLRRQLGPLSIQRVPSSRELNRFPYEYIIVPHDPKLNKWTTTLYYGDIDLHLRLMAELLGAHVETDVIYAKADTWH